MAPTRTRSPSPVTSNKRLKPNVASNDEDLSSHFATGLLNDSTVLKLHAAYKKSEPFKHCVLDKLFQDALLKQVKDECIGELSFTEKATDIYRVHQTGDLASLSYLAQEQLDVLPSLLALRNALYSPQFRNFLRAVTGCGPLSGSKQDMSVNSYKTGCHLLNHDDVIGTRRVSYILYMPLPADHKWEEAWGGSLELYPVDKDGEPKTVPSKKILPAWNQFIFFEVQPGHSFHSVEEVVVGGCKDSRDRLSISGWFHKAQGDEEGYEPEPPEHEKSSLEQLSASVTRPLANYPTDQIPPLPSETSLTEEHISFLSEYLNPVYLSAKTLPTLAERFAAESSLELHSFLCEPLAAKLQTGLRGLDSDELLGPSRNQRIPSHTNGAELGSAWRVVGPPHKQRYCVLATKVPDPISPHAAKVGAAPLLRSLQDHLFPSPAFRAWLALVSSLLPIQFTVEARRFRPGLDYTLATSDDKDARLDVVLGLTPEVEVEGKGKAKVEVDWDSGEWGGWECYMAAQDGDDDPAVYGSGSHQKSKDGEKLSNGHANGHKPEEEDEEEGDDDSGTLLTVQPGFNRLLLALRDPGVLHFVKYVSAMAPGSRWDISGEWEVGQVELGSDEEDGEQEDGETMDAEEDGEGEEEES